MIRYQFFPRSRGVTPEINAIIDCFEKADKKKGEEQVTSNEMLAIVRPYLEELKFHVETGKSNDKKISIPVLFGENNEIDKSFAADAVSADGRIVIEVEAGRAVFNNQFLKDIFQACMMFRVEYLVIAVLNEYHFSNHGKEQVSQDFKKIQTFLETLYVSSRLVLPLKGILLLGY